MTKRLALICLSSLLIPFSAAAGPAPKNFSLAPGGASKTPPTPQPTPTTAPTPPAPPARPLLPNTVSELPRFDPTDEPHAGMLVFSDETGDEDWLAPQLSNEVTIDVTGMILRAQVTQVFENTTDTVVEATYLFPLPETAAVDTLTLMVGDRLIVGQMREREQARQDFERAKSQGKKASLIEQERPNLFTSAVANIGPHEQVQVQISYQQDIKFDGGKFSFDFPATLTPRYIPGGEPVRGSPGTGWGVNTAAVPDAERVTPPVTSDAFAPTLDVKVTLDPGFPLKKLTCLSHDVRILAAPAPNQVALRLAEGPVLADRDFRLEWEPERGSVPRTSLFEEEFKGQRYALLMVLPPEPAQDDRGRLPREAVFVIDTSGSMAGTSIEQARRSLASGLQRLRVDDEFNVIEFNSGARTLFPKPVPATPTNVALALGWVNGLEADGGTEMLSALELALKENPKQERVRQVVFITDGSVGNESDVLRFIQSHLNRQRLFTVGIGSAPNQYFMRGAARFGRGTFTYVADLEDVNTEMNALWAKLDAPVMNDLALEWRGDAPREVWPERLPDLYRSEPLVVLAKLGPQSSATRLSGRRGKDAFSAELKLASASSAGAPAPRQRGIHRLWARRKIEGLMDRMIEGESEEGIRPLVIALSLEHQVMSKYASLVAVDTVRSVDGPAITVAVPNAVPAGNEMFGNLPQTATPAPTCLLLGVLSFAGAALVGLRWRP